MAKTPPTSALTSPNFSKVMSVPQGQIGNRGALLKEAETDVAGLLEKVNDMDDLVIQFAGTDAGNRFTEAWKRARIIVDKCHRCGSSPSSYSANRRAESTPT